MSVNFTTNNPYKDFIGQSANPNNSPSVVLPQQSAPTVKVGDINTKTDKNKKKIFGIIGVSVGSVLLLGIIAVFSLSKGFSGSIARRLTKISESARNKIYELSTQTKELTNTQKLKLQIHKGIQHSADTMQATSNISAVKDSLMYRCMKKLRLDKLSDKITDFFKNKLVVKTKNNAYKSAEYSAVEFCNYVEKIAKEKGDLNLAQKAKQIMQEYSKAFSTQSHVNRTEEAWTSMENLHDEVYKGLFKGNVGIFSNLKNLRSYITTDIIAPQRTKMFKEVLASKSKITNSLSDVDIAIKQALKDIKISVNPQNKRALEIVKSISQLIETHKNLAGIDESIARKELFGKIKSYLAELLNITQNDIKSPKELSLAKNRIHKFCEILSENSYKKGLAQEVVTDIKKLLATEGGKESYGYKQASKLLQEMNSKLNYAISKEDITYEKLAELRVGSAPADIFGIIWPTVLGTVLIVNSKDKNERISNTLTQGIPILGGAATTYYGTLRGWTGAKNLAIGFGTAYLLNVIGTKTDELVKKYLKEQAKLRKAFDAFTKLKAEKHAEIKKETKIEKSTV